MPPETIAEIIAQTLCCGGWSEEAIVRRVRRVLRPHVKGTKWLRPFAARLLQNETASRDLRSDPGALISLILSDPDFEREVGSAVYIDYELDVAKIARPNMTPASVAKGWNVPSITDSKKLADWFALSISHLDWLADRRGLERFANNEKLRNYRYRWIPKRTGGRR